MGYKEKMLMCLKGRKCIINPKLTEKAKLNLLGKLFVVYQAPVDEDTFISLKVIEEVLKWLTGKGNTSL